MPSITRVHWSAVGPRSWGGRSGALFALWPAPVDHDACFARAGFLDFADSDDPWDEDFRALLHRLVKALSRYGPPEVAGADPPPPTLLGRMLRRKETWLPADRLRLAAEDDQFACSARFGAPPQAVACTMDGHPLVWAWFTDEAKGDWPAHLAAVGAEKRVERIDLNWEPLGPPPEFGRT